MVEFQVFQSALSGTMDSMLQTPLYEIQKHSGAKMISFGGWEMPRDYGNGTAAEVRACRSGTGIFDISHMGEFRVHGGEALDFLQHVTTNDASRLKVGQAQYSLLLNETGGVIDDIIVYRDSPDNYLIVVNAGCKDKDWEWLSLQARAYRTRLSDESDETALIAVQGPKARGLVAELVDRPMPELRRFHCVTILVAGVGCTVSRTGYTGEDGYEIFCCSANAPKLWEALVDRGAIPCGLASRDVLRIEAAYPLYGHELTDYETPLGLGLGWAIKTTKPDFVGRNDIIKRSQDGLRESLVGLTMVTPKAIPREGQSVFASGLDDPIGRVTSGTLSPTVGKGIAMARIGAGFAEENTPLIVDIRGRRADALVTPLPFYRGLDH
jgi:aminomethyltransferase